MNASADRAVVLLIEDHTDTREMYALMLGAAGFVVLEMDTAENALAQPLPRVPAVVVTDLRMPGGVTALDLCRHFSARDIPVILLTAVVSASEHDDMRRAGCASVLVKPLPPDALLTEVRHVIERRASSLP